MKKYAIIIIIIYIILFVMATFVLISGVGRLIAEAKVTPIVIPFWHEGNYIPS